MYIIITEVIVAIAPGIIKLWSNIYFPDFVDPVLSHSTA